jgi:thioredoxin reductase (NADPH)
MARPPQPAVLDDPTDPFLRQAQTYPQLSDEQIARVARHGVEESLAEGALLYERGQRGVDFFLVLAGAVEVFDFDESGTRYALTVHRERQFTGEMNVFNEREILVSAHALSDTRVVRIRREHFRRFMAAEPDIGEIVMRAYILRRVGFIRHGLAGVVLVGRLHDPDALRLQRFMVRNGYPHRFLDTEHDDASLGLAASFELKEADLPAVILHGRTTLKNPTNEALADALGLTEDIDEATIHDVVVVGAGPAGLAAAVYAASEGLTTLMIESTAPGGQAGTSSKIENYLGFPTGISGQALAGRAQAQAQKFGARIAVARTAIGLDCSVQPYRVLLDGGRAVSARAVVVATGARYRKLDLADFERFENAGIHYAATAMEAHLCRGEDIAVIGGGNSAGQAAMFLSRYARHVHVVIRRSSLASTMSDYLIQRIESSPQISVHESTDVTRLEGDHWLRRVELTDRTDGRTSTHAIANLFLMIGADPNTGWLRDCLPLDAKGFVRTGAGADGTMLDSPFATTLPGVYAVGDVRSGSVKRIASGVGEGSIVVQSIHRFLHPDLV